MTKKSLLLCGVATAALNIAAPTFAQTEPSTAQRSAGAPDQVEEVVVTAERREEISQRIPVSVSAVPAAAIERANITNAIDIGKLVPAALFQENNGTVTTFIRGIGNSQTPVGNEASNALYIDGVYYGRITPIAMELDDVERVEILKGPQGTLFGRNSESGLIQIITNTPDPNAGFAGKLSAGYGNFDTYDSKVYLSDSIASGVAASFAGVYHDQETGWGRDILNGDDRLKSRDYAARSKVEIVPATGTEITISGDYSYSNGDIGTFQIYRKGGTPADPKGQAGYPPGSPDFGQLLPLFGFYDDYTNTPNFSETKDYGVSIRASQELPFATLVDTAAYRNDSQLLSNDTDEGPTFYAGDYLQSFSRQISNELQLLSPADSVVEWTAGFFYYNQHFGYSPNTEIDGSYIGLGPYGYLLVPASGRNESYALYGQAAYHITPQLRLTLGVRGTEDLYSAGGAENLYIGDHVTPQGTSGGGSLLEAINLGSAHKTVDELSWKGALDYQWTDDIMTYASVSRGFKGGIYNILTFNPNFVKPEVLTAYELGAKTEFFDNRLRVNAAGFYYDQRDPQVFVVPRPGTDELINAQSATVKGVEAEADAVVTEHLNAHINATFLNSEYTSFNNAAFYPYNPAPPYGFLPPTKFDATGNPLARAPDFSGNIGFDYTIPVSAGEFAIAANYEYIGKFYWDPDLQDVGGNYGLVDAQVSFAFADSGMKLTVWGSNLGSSHYYTSEFEQGGPAGAGGAVGAPRTYGVRLDYKFP
jgi:iron complex outermembrane receptor protein